MWIKFEKIKSYLPDLFYFNCYHLLDTYAIMHLHILSNGNINMIKLKNLFLCIETYVLDCENYEKGFCERHKSTYAFTG